MHPETGKTIFFQYPIPKGGLPINIFWSYCLSVSKIGRKEKNVQRPALQEDLKGNLGCLVNWSKNFVIVEHWIPWRDQLRCLSYCHSYGRNESFWYKAQGRNFMAKKPCHATHKCSKSPRSVRLQFHPKLRFLGRTRRQFFETRNDQKEDFFHFLAPKEQLFFFRHQKKTIFLFWAP